MKKNFNQFIKYISYVPFLNWTLYFFYNWARARLRLKLSHISNVEDIVIISDLSSGEFIFGQSDYNLMIITNNTKKVKKLLGEVREVIRSHPLVSLVFNSNYIPIITKEEFATSLMKSFVLRNYSQHEIVWDSLLFNKKYQLQAPVDHNFALIYFAIQNLDFYLCRTNEIKSKRSHVKNIARAIITLEHFFSTRFKIDSNYIKMSHLLMKYEILSNLFYGNFEKRSWKILSPSKKEIMTAQNSINHILPEQVLLKLNKLKKNPFIDDIIVTPSLIQKKDQPISGKFFLEIIVNDKIFKENPFKLKKSLRSLVKKLQNDHLKIRYRFLNRELYDLKNFNYLYPYPLEPLYRKKLSQSLNKISYDYPENSDIILESIIHFFITQVMRFRSLEQKSDLIGSKFIKSLNLMFRYYQILQYLKTGKLIITHRERDVRAALTPQFSSLGAMDLLSEEHWQIVEHQLHYFLKKIKEELIKQDETIEFIQL